MLGPGHLLRRAGGGRLGRFCRRGPHDQLTGQLNRAGIFEVLEQHVAAARDGSRPGPGLLFIDLDDFKPVNDRYGHAAGDRLLQLVAQRLAALLRPEDSLARLGGDEFIVALAPPLDPSGLQLVASRAQRALNIPFTLPETVVHISASIGTASWKEGTTSVDEHLHRADSAMYEDKASRARAHRRASLSVPSGAASR